MRLKVEYARLGDLSPYANNSKEHPSWQVEQIANSIDQFGFNDPVGVWTNPDGVLEIVEGHGRVMACEQLGRRCRMMELDPHYCDVIIDRWERLTGRKAVLDEHGQK